MKSPLASSVFESAGATYLAADAKIVPKAATRRHFTIMPWHPAMNNHILAEIGEAYYGRSASVIMQRGRRKFRRYFSAQATSTTVFYRDVKSCHYR